MPAGTRRPDEDDHRAIEEPDGDEAILAIVRRSSSTVSVAPASTSSALKAPCPVLWPPRVVVRFAVSNSIGTI